MVRGVFAFALVSLTLAGCGWTLLDHQPEFPIRPNVAPASYRLDLEASAVQYRGNNNPTYAEALEVRNAVGELLRSRARTTGPDKRPAPPARFRALIDLSRTVWPLSWTIVCMDLQPLGCPTGQAHATAMIELQVGSDIYVGRGTGSGLGGLYYNAFTGTPSALEEAIETAISSLTLAGRVPQPPVWSYPGTPSDAIFPLAPYGPGAGVPEAAGGGIQ
jgi:hypothetical protein